MGFLSSLGTAINEQFGMSENSVTSLDTVNDKGRVKPFGLLGDFANKFDHSAQRSYIEDGFVRNVRPRLHETIWQQPDIAVIIKKRMFSSLAENYQLENLEEGEKLFIRASKKLFQNKCRAIAVYERLTKIEQLAKDAGHVSSFMLPMLMSGIAELENAGLLQNIMDQKTHATFDALRKVYAFSEPSSTTAWMIDNETAFMSELGEGTGVIELTMVQGISTKASVSFHQGSASFTVEDPYKLLVVSTEEIDIAIRDATNWFKTGPFGRFADINLKKLIENQKQELNQSRRARGVSEIAFSVTPVTIVSKKVKAILQGGVVGPAGSEIETPEINFKYNPGLVGIGSAVTIDPVATQGPQGLNNNDQRLFKEIIKNIFLLLSYEQNTRSQVVQFNKETNLVRRKMMLHFGGKSIIQPMDIVNVFCSSKTMIDEKIVQGFDLQSKGLNFADRLDNLVRNINSTFDKFSNAEEGRQSIDEIEKAAIAGPEFPTWLWRLCRNDFTRQGAGVAIFVGLVTSARHTYSDGKYTLSVSCEDNAGYFSKSQINIKPSTDTFNQVLYDPLTPFKVSFDAASGAVLNEVQIGQFPELLNENMVLLQSEAVKFHTGRLRGQPVNSLLYQAQDGELSFNSYRRVLNDPLGFVYRWKEGIGTLTKIERAYPETSLRKEQPVALTNNPFAGQDTMNVLSLLVTGQPYNYNTFLKSAIDNANSLVSRDEATNKGAVVTYIEALTNDLSKRNAMWGNFIPFKKLSINKDADNFIRSGINDFNTKNEKLTTLVKTRAGLLDQLAEQSGGYVQGPDFAGRDARGQFTPLPPGASTPLIIDLRRKIQDLDRQIEDAKRRFTTSITNLSELKPNGRIKIIGDDVSLDPSNSNTPSARSEEQRQHDDDDFRRKINFLTQRRLWKVKGNEDNNLFIVDDQYDKNFDIQAFDRKLSGKLDLFKSDYVTIESQIKQVAEILGLEIFADTQGHIQVRPPLYNKMPSSVFYRMFKDKAEKGIQVFPQFLESLLFNQLQAQINRIEIIEDEIRIRVLAIGVVSKNPADPDRAIAAFLRGSQGNLDQTTGSVDASFSFVSDSNGKVSAFYQFTQQARPDLNQDFINNALVPVSKAFNEAAKANRLFDAVARTDALAKIKFDAAFAQENQTKIDDISKRLEREKGVQAPTIRDLFSNDRRSGQISQLDAVKVLGEISSFVSERQKLLTSVIGTLKNLTQGIELNASDKGATAGLFPSLNRRQSIPGILQHMIEHEDNDDLGPNSGNRFVIRERNIISLSIEETPPDHTLVNVNGLFGDGITDIPQRLSTTTEGGNAIASAYAVDYDMWRMYGFRVPHSISVPFFSDADTQCAPFAVFLLNRARRDILRGTAEVVGNEYYQPGDVVYIEDRDLLFYVTEVSQNFNYSGSFTTTLTLRFGHVPGDYIPTILDIVGKYIYGAKDFTNIFRSNRFSNANGEIPIASVIFDNKITSEASELDQLLSGNRGAQNVKAMTQMLFATSGALNRNSFSGQRPVLKIRVYAPGGAVNGSLFAAAQEVKLWLQNPQKKTANGTIISINKDNEGINIPPLNNVYVEVIDVSSDHNHTPSQSAWNSARTLLKHNSIPTNTKDDAEVRKAIADAVAAEAKQLNQLLYTNIIDAWLTFEDVDDTIQTGPTTTNNQAAQQQQADLNAAAVNFAKSGRS
jgi:hypothetical protein